MLDGPSAAPVRVVMVDLLSIVPYYCAHLCGSLLAERGINVLLGAVKYRHDPACFHRHGVANSPIGVDCAASLRHLPRRIRQRLRGAEYLFNLTALFARIIVIRPAVLHIQFLPLLSYGSSIELWFVRAFRSLGCRIVYTVHNVLPQDTGDEHRALYARLYSQADQLICHDCRSADRLQQEFSIPSARIRVIPHGPFFNFGPRKTGRDSRVRLRLEAGEPLVLWQGIIRPYKGVSFLLKVWQQVCAVNSKACLVIAGTGDPELLESVREEVVSLGIAARVRMEFRFLTVDEVVDLCDAADIIVYPYREITTSGALMTGISAGKAIVASALPAFQQVLRDEESALLAPYGDVEGWARRIVRLLADAELRQYLGGHLRGADSGLPTWKEIARYTLKCYEAAIRPPIQIANHSILP